MVHSYARRFAFLATLLSVLLVGGCGESEEPKAAPKATKAAPLAPLGPHAVTFYGSTKFQNKFDPLGDASCLNVDKRHKPPQRGKQPAKSKAPDDPPLNVLCLLADTNDHVFTGPAAGRTAYRDA